MKYLLLSITLIFFLPVLYAQQDITLPGLVVEQNSKYRTGDFIYLSNAQVKAAGAKPQYSDVNGRFTLLFSDRPGGDMTRIFAAKDGYEVVNEAELKQASIIGRLQPLKIVMCKEGQLYENQVRYYNIAKEANLTTYQHKIAILEKGGRKKEQLLTELRKQFNRDIKTKEDAIALLEQQRQIAEKQARELADKWVTVNLDDESPAYQRAFAAFEAGNIELSKVILDSVDLEKRLELNNQEKTKEMSLIDTLKKSISARETEIQQDVNICVFKARLHVLYYEFSKAERLYNLAVGYDTSRFEIIFEAANFMREQNQFKRAKNYYEKALLKYNNDVQKYLILNNMGLLLGRINEKNEARKAFGEALKIGRQLAAKTPDAYLPDVATVLNNLGNLLNEVNEKTRALEAFEEALQIRRQLAVPNPDAYLPDVAATLNNIGNLLKANNKNVASRKFYEEALQIYRQLVDRKLNAYLPAIASVLNNFGTLLNRINEKKEARKVFDESLQIRRQLATKNPDVYLPDVAVTLNNLGFLQSETNEVMEARKSFEESLEIRRQLAAKNPDTYLPDVAITLNNLGTLLYRINEIARARKAYEEALQIKRRLAFKNPDVYLPDVAATLNNLGNLLTGINEKAGAQKAFEEALEIRRQLAAKNPDAYLPDVATTLNNLGILLSEASEKIKATEALEEVLYIKKQIASKNPLLYNLDVVIASVNVGLLYQVLLNSNGNMLLKSKGRELMYEALQRLTAYKEITPKIELYKNYARGLLDFFNEFNEITYKFNQQLKELNLFDSTIIGERDVHQRVLRQEEKIFLLIELQKDYFGELKNKNLIAQAYGYLAWYQLFDRQFIAAETSANFGLQNDATEEWINRSLALALLYQEKWDDAKKIYLKYVDKPYPATTSTFRKVFLKDLEELQKEGITCLDIEKAKKLLSGQQ